MRTRDRSLIANAASLLVCGVLAGIVVAAAAFPAIALSGLTAKASADGFGELPSELNVLPSPQITYVYASDNKTLLATIYDENRHDINFADIPLVMRNAIIAAEDERFYVHNGVDLQGILRAFVANQQSDSTQGASTLTMQYVRQAITYSATSPAQIIAATEQTNARKLREARLALSLETVLTKDEILERYLNIAAFGHGAYGIYAASQVYFNKEPEDLSLEEAALLAGLPKAPSAFDPVTAEGRPQALARRAYVLDQMAGLNMITRAQAETAKKSELKVTGKRTPNGCVATLQNHWGFFCDYLYRWWQEQADFGVDASERIGKLKSGGYRIVTSLDAKLQATMKKYIDQQIKSTNSDALMMAAIEPGTGLIKGMAVNRTYGLDTSKNKLSSDPRKHALGIKGTYPTTTNPLISGGGDITGYKGGSSFKLFTMLAALEKGFPLDFQINAVSPYQSKYIVGRNDPSVCADGVHWCPKNANTQYMNGPNNMWTGFGKSVNTYFVPLEEKVGADKAVEMAKRLGIQFRAKGTKDSPADYEYAQPGRSQFWGPFTIGVSDMVPLELANAYATVAADGKYCEPMPVIDIVDGRGTKLTSMTQPRCKQVVKADVARAAIDAARCPIYDQSAFGRCAGGTSLRFPDGKRTREVVGKPLAGKTGTSDDNWTANLVLTTKQLTIAGTLANPDYAQTPHTVETGARIVQPAVTFTMRDAMRGLPGIDFAKTSSKLAQGTRVRVPPVTCATVRAATRTLESAGFDVSVAEKKVDSPCPDGTVATTDPTGTTSKGSTIILVLSNGKVTVPTPGPSGPGGGGGGGGGGPGHGGGGGGLIG